MIGANTTDSTNTKYEFEISFTTLLFKSTLKIISINKLVIILIAKKKTNEISQKIIFFLITFMT